MPRSLIFDIKRYAINDGPGIRVAIFFKGCNLICAWCHNPEGISRKAELMYAQSKCIVCGTCASVCPEKAIKLYASGIEIDPSLCTSCGKCAGICPTRALEMSGKRMKSEEILEIIEKERPFFEQSGGGVTFSGGEPLLHTEMLFPLLDECGKKGIHRAIDTAGNVDTNIILEAAKRCELFLYDLKHIDTELHKEYTGTGNTLILENLRRLASTGARIIIRIPVIGEVNDDLESLEKTAAFIAALPGEPKEVHLLPYHSIAQHKCAKLRKPGDFIPFEEPSPAVLTNAREIFKSFNINTIIGG